MAINQPIRLRWGLMATVLVVIFVTTACGYGRQSGASAQTDSDAYYQQLMEQHKRWYAAMNVDSMVMSSERIHQYLSKHQNDENDARRRLKAEWLKARGVYYTAILGRPDSGLVYTERALQQMEGLTGIDGLRIIAMANRGDFYRQLGQMDRSVDAYLQALEEADATGMEDTMKVALLLGVSTAYTFMGDYQNSQRWWQKTSHLVPQMNKGDLFIYYNNRGNDHYFQQQYKEALDCFTRAAELVKGNDDKKWDYYTALTNLGEIEVCLGNAESARAYITKADSFFHAVDFQPLLYYLETERIELALVEGRKAEALRMVQHCEYKDVAIPAAKLLRLKAEEQVMNETGHYQDAYRAHQQLHQLKDSIQNANTQMQMNARLMQYEHDKRLIEQQRTIDQERMQSRLAWALLAVALLAVCLLGVLTILWRRRQRMKDVQTRQQIIGMRMENTRNRITPHFIYNALSHEMLAQMEGKEPDLSHLTQLLRRGIEQADVLETTLAEELNFVDYYVSIERQQMPQPLLYSKVIAEDVDTKSVRLPAMTIQIFVENAVKHGLRRQGGELTIRIKRHEKNTLVEVIDNGQGLSPSYQEHTGMRVVRQTIQMLNECNRQQIDFGLENLEQGCRSWLLLPDDYHYNLT